MELHSAIHLLLLLAIFTCSSRAEIVVGFTAAPNPDVESFQPLLTDSSGNYSLGFLRVNRNHLSLSVLHLPSSVPLWSAATSFSPKWANPTRLSFNGSLILSDAHNGVYWSTNTAGDRVWLSNTSNLIIQKLAGDTILWQSFDFPSDTLVENQNFTSAMALVSSNGLYSMRLGQDFMGLYAKFSDSDQIYLRHRALEAKADIVPGQPIYMVLKSDGFLGMYQTGSLPVDVQSFNTFQQNVSGIRRVRIEPDGNLKGYYWTGSGWSVDYQAISEPCELPNPCGSYGLCIAGKDCSCLDNRTVPVHSPGGCAPPGNQIPGDLCGAYDNRFGVLRRTGVELPFKELMSYERTASYDECERSCEGNCTCWGVVYSNFSGFCYRLDYPVETVVGVRDESKMGYFKVRESVGKKKVGEWVGLGLGLVFGAILIFAGVLGLWWYKGRSRGVKGYGEDEGGLGVGPYKDLGAASFRSIELCER